MPKRYVCTNCMTVKPRGTFCRNCGEERVELTFRHTPWTTLPYLLAVIAGCILLMSYLTDMFIIIWLTFPIIATGLIIDHFCQKQIDDESLKKAKNLK